MRPRSPYPPSIAALAVALLIHRSRRRRRAEYRHLVSRADPVGDVRTHSPMGTAALGLAALLGGGYLMSRELRRGPAESSSTVEESIELEVPVSTAYNQWTQFEDFPKFMATVEAVNQIDTTHLHWRAIVGGKIKEWDAEITEQIPDERIAWRSTSGVRNSGVVTFHKITDSRTRVMLRMDYDPQNLVEKVADAGGAVKLTTKGNLKRFKKLLETRGQETGAWRGTITQH